jgi:hypothetical protein
MHPALEYLNEAREAIARAKTAAQRAQARRNLVEAQMLAALAGVA